MGARTWGLRLLGTCAIWFASYRVGLYFAGYDVLARPAIEPLASSAERHTAVSGTVPQTLGDTLLGQPPAARTGVPIKKRSKGRAARKRKASPSAISKAAAAIHKAAAAKRQGKAAAAMRVAIAITVTKESSGGYLDGAAVLAHSVRLTQSEALPTDMIAIMPSALLAGSPPMVEALTKAGYIVMPFDYNITEADIKGPLSKEIGNSGCCGMAELTKLGAFGLVKYDRVLIMDSDTIVMQNMDELFLSKKEVMYTYDTYLGGGCINGGFAVVTPSKKILGELLGLVIEGDWRGGGAWGGSNIGYCYGGPTFQGLIPFYYQASRYKRAEDQIGALDHAIYNQMVGPDKEEQDAPLRQIKSAHFTNCQKPWTCQRPGTLCKDLHREWWKVLQNLEQAKGVPPEKRHAAFDSGCDGGYTPLDWDDFPDAAGLSEDVVKEAFGLDED